MMRGESRLTAGGAPHHLTQELNYVKRTKRCPHLQAGGRVEIAEIVEMSSFGGTKRRLVVAFIPTR
jgi:hypothetical protein